jgi:hypothetical protein
MQKATYILYMSKQWNESELHITNDKIEDIPTMKKEDK